MGQEREIVNFVFSASLAENKPIRIPLSGMSMYPTLREKDLLIAKPIRYYEARVGDILAYQNFDTKQILVHRLVRIIEHPGTKTLLTVAEALRAQGYDPPLTPDNCIISKVVSFERGGRKIDLLKLPQIMKGRAISYLLEHVPVAIAVRKKCHWAIEKPSLIPKNIFSLFKIITRHN